MFDRAAEVTVTEIGPVGFVKTNDGIRDVSFRWNTRPDLSQKSSLDYIFNQSLK